MSDFQIVLVGFCRGYHGIHQSTGKELFVWLPTRYVWHDLMMLKYLSHLVSRARFGIYCAFDMSLHEPQHDKSNKMTFVPSEDSDQRGHPSNLLRVFAVRMKKPRVLGYPLSAQRRLIRRDGWPGWYVFAGRKCHFVGFVIWWLTWHNTWRATSIVTGYDQLRIKINFRITLSWFCCNRICFINS